MYGTFLVLVPMVILWLMWLFNVKGHLKTWQINNLTSHEVGIVNGCEQVCSLIVMQIST